MSQTIRKSATVKVMNSHNYNHFEASICLENDEGVSNLDIDEARKDCQRLVQKAILQYDKSKRVALAQANSASEKRILEMEVASIKQKPKEQWGVTEKAKVKALEDHNWEQQWDWEDDSDDYSFC